MKRILKWAVLVILVLLIAGGLIFYFSLNGIVERTVERQATDSLKLNTELDSATVSLFGGRLNLNDLQIDQPAGFGEDKMFTLGKADVSVSLGQLRKDPVHVNSVTLNKPKLVIERSADNTFNFKKAMDLMPPSDPNAKPLKVVIDQLTVEGATVVIRPNLAAGNLPQIPGLDLSQIPEELTVPVPTITMSNIGTGEGSENGAAMKDVAMQVITALAAEAANSDLVGEQLKGLQAMLNQNVQSVVANLGAEAQKRVAEALGGEAGQIVGAVLEDPEALMRDPGKALGKGLEKGRAEVERNVRKAAEEQIGNLLGGKSGKNRDGDAAREGEAGEGSDARDRNDARTNIEERVTEELSEGLGGLLGGRKDEKGDAKDERDEKDRAE